MSTASWGSPAPPAFGDRMAATRTPVRPSLASSSSPYTTSPRSSHTAAPASPRSPFRRGSKCQCVRTDILGQLFRRGCYGVTARILSYLSPSDLERYIFFTIFILCVAHTYQDTSQKGCNSCFGILLFVEVILKIFARKFFSFFFGSISLVSRDWNSALTGNRANMLRFQRHRENHRRQAREKKRRRLALGQVSRQDGHPLISFSSCSHGFHSLLWLLNLRGWSSHLEVPGSQVVLRSLKKEE